MPAPRQARKRMEGKLGALVVKIFMIEKWSNL